MTLAERMDSGMIRRIQQLHDAAHPGGDDRRPGAEGAGAQDDSRAGARGPGHAPRRGEARRPFDHRADARRPFEQRGDARAPFEHRGGEAPRPARGNPFDRALPVRDERRAPARPGPASFKPRGKPTQRPRPGGYSR